MSSDATRETVSVNAPDVGVGGLVSSPAAGGRSAIRRALSSAPWLFVAILGLIVVAAVAAPLVSPRDHTETNVLQSRLPPAWEDGGNWSYPLGTDNAGRDTLSRLIYGARTSLLIAVTSVALAFLVGTAVGVMTAYFGSWVDATLMRLVDAILAVPTILVALMALAIFGSSISVLVAVIAFVIWAPIARVARADALAVMGKSYILATEAMGAGPVRTILLHVVPNIVGSLAVIVTLLMGTVILLEASLSFLGLGVQPPEASWGEMLANGRRFMRVDHWLVTLPGLAIFLTVLSVNRIGDWLRDYIDPHGLERPRG
jgi:peptide/nickel transport system permease protein